MSFINLTRLTAVLLLIAAPAGSELPPLPTIDGKVDLERYAGDWYVHGNIPIRIPFFSDAEAFNYTESYELQADGSVRLTCAFRVGGFEGKNRTFSFKGKVSDKETFATWKVSLMWPIKASYRIIYLDENYKTSIVATADRRYAWIMSRDTSIDDALYDELLAFLAGAGYETEKIRNFQNCCSI